MAVRSERLQLVEMGGAAVGVNEIERYNKHGFWAHFMTMAQGAFNDNVLKYLIVYFLVNAAAHGVTLFGWELTEARILAVGTVVFSLPFIILPGIVGALSDRFPKKHVMVFSKGLELVLMGLVFFAFLEGSPLVLFGLLFMMAAQSALYGPGKYGILPEALPDSKLSWANGMFQMGTLVAIIAGVGIAGPLYDWLTTFGGGHIEYSAAFLLAFSALGLMTSLNIFLTPAANPAQRLTFNPWAGMGRYLRIIWNDRRLFTVTVGYCFFWFAGIVVNSNITLQGETELQMSATSISLALALTSIGIGLGSLTAGFVSRGRVELGLVPLGTLGMALFCMLLGFGGLPMLQDAGAQFGENAQGISNFGIAWMIVMLMALGFGAGFFDVPLAASVQKFAPSDAKGGIVATSNMLTFLGMLLGGVVFFVFGEIGLSGYDIYIFIGVFSLAVGGFMCWSFPQMILRAALWIANSTVLRHKVVQQHYLPEDGGALVVSSHISVIDALFLMAATDRNVYFVMGDDVHTQPWSRRFAKWLLRIEVPVGASETELAEVTALIRQRLAEGHIVCVPTDARFHKDGPVMPWSANFGVLTEGLEVPIVPVHQTRLWNVLYLVQDGQLTWKRPKTFPLPIYTRFGEAVSDPTGGAVRAAVERLGTATHLERPLRYELLHRGFIKTARRFRKNLCIADNTTGELSYLKALIGSIIFAQKLNTLLGEQKYVGVLLPTTVGGALTNIALQLMGRVPVNLNYTASNEAIASAARQCGITHVITAKAFLQRLPLQVPGQAIFLEDVKAMATGKDRIIGLLLALFAPVGLIERVCGSRGKRSEHDVATIIFSSGSEGEPKGVVLTQRNILSNIESALEIFPHGKGDCMLGFLPFFHSFGFTGTLWMCLLSGLTAVFHPNPLEPKVIGALCEKYKATFLIATSTFLQGFIRKCAPEQLQTLNFVVCGAEKLAPRVRTAFMEKFGAEPLEGYGTTECSPVVSVNLPNCESPGFFHESLRHGSIGRTLPGISVRVVDADTGDLLTHGEVGLLQVSGPNLMRGYLNLEEKTRSVLQDGWYSTGDIAAIDDDRFIRITDRLSRFSKIAGEMVPHTKVEETLHQLLGLTEQSMAVASVPDAQKGERLVVLHTLEDGQVEALVSKLDGSDLPNLWRPRSTAFYKIDAIPVLATGKMDIRSVKQLASTFESGDGK